MKNYKFVLALLAVWVPVAVAVCFAIYYTHEPKCLFAFLIPGFIKVSYQSTDDNEEGNKNDE